MNLKGLSGAIAAGSILALCISTTTVQPAAASTASTHISVSQAAVLSSSTAKPIQAHSLSGISGTRPTHLTGGEHTCSYTNPEFMLSDNNMNITVRPGSTWFHATWTKGHHPWKDAYWITGAHDEWASICNSREIPGTKGSHGKALILPARVGYPAIIRGSLKAHGDGRIGFDLWFTASRSEVTPTEMEHDPRTWEVMVMPGNGHYIFRDHPGWHRVYLGMLPRKDGVISFKNLSLTKVAKKAGVPKNLYWMTIGAGGETDFGNFYVDSYSLQAMFYAVGTSSPPFPSYHPKKKPPVYIINRKPIVKPGHREGMAA